MECCCKTCLHRNNKLCTRYEDFHDEEQLINCDECDNECETLYCAYYTTIEYIRNRLNEVSKLYICMYGRSGDEVIEINMDNVHVNKQDDSFTYYFGQFACDSFDFKFSDYGITWVFEEDVDTLKWR